MAKDNFVLRCPVCGTPLVDDICPGCGYVQIYFPSSVPKVIEEFQKNRTETIKAVEKRHSDAIAAAKGDAEAAWKQAERFRTELGQANETIRTQKKELDAKERELASQAENFQIELGRANDAIKRQKAELDAKDRNLDRMAKEMEELKKKLREAERKGAAPQLPLGFTISPGKDFIGTMNGSGEREGLGMSIESEGKFYMGDWKLDLKTGVGVRSDRGGRKYAGQFRMDRPNGVGVMVDSDGSGFAGEWKNGKKSGGGMTAKPNGEKMFARYEGGVMSSSAGAYFLQDGSIVCGRMTELGPTGSCVHYFPDGSVEQESWRNGIKI